MAVEKCQKTEDSCLKSLNSTQLQIKNEVDSRILEISQRLASDNYARSNEYKLINSKIDSYGRTMVEKFAQEHDEFQKSIQLSDTSAKSYVNNQIEGIRNYCNDLKMAVENDLRTQLGAYSQFKIDIASSLQSLSQQTTNKFSEIDVKISDLDQNWALNNEGFRNLIQEEIQSRFSSDV